MPAGTEMRRFPAGFQIQNVPTNGTTLHVRIGGKGPAAVLLHGYGETGDMWVPLAAALVRDHTVIVPDLRGMGLSSRPEGGYDKKTQGRDVAGVLDALTRRTSSPTISATWSASPLPHNIRAGSSASS
jgi:pimeloyl-ACP methyl ester carboxylesterase